MVPERAEEGVVDRDRRRIVGEQSVACGGDRLDVDQGVGRIGRALEVDERHPPLPLGLLHHRIDLRAGRAGGKIEPADSKAPEDSADQSLGRGIERAGMDDDVAGLDEGHQEGGDRRHAAREAERVLGILPQAEPVLEDLLIGAVEARIDEAFGAAGPLAGDAFEMALSGGGILEHEGRGEEDGRLQRAFRQGRIEAVAHHQRRGLELAPADLEHARLRTATQGGAGEIGFVFHGESPDAGTPLADGANLSSADAADLRRSVQTAGAVPGRR